MRPAGAHPRWSRDDVTKSVPAAAVASRGEGGADERKAPMSGVDEDADVEGGGADTDTRKVPMNARTSSL